MKLFLSAKKLNSLVGPGFSPQPPSGGVTS
jgi:hypothetical protein